ncbi:hypothetical protein [Nocardioides sp. LS1]|uniref:hypothetical protein n=1 Tax=Nocardioides sp. LS1 TaxID=1027620 RepID=UPI000F61E697|nr:hypothetical protein [Nocardioides sp. LS1]
MRHLTAPRALRPAAALAVGVLVAGLAPGLGLSPAHAGGAQHVYVPEEFDGTEHWSSQENMCGPWATTFHEVRHGGYDVVRAPGGQVPGEVHINGAVDGWIQLTPDDPTRPTYTGTYREKVDGVVTNLDDDSVRVMQFRLRVPMTGTDGSRLLITLSGKTTVNANGTVTVDRPQASCS